MARQPRLQPARRPRPVPQAGRGVRHLDGKLQARLLHQVGPDRRCGAGSQPQTRDRARVGLRPDRPFRLSGPRLVRHDRAGVRRPDVPDRLPGPRPAHPCQPVDRGLHYGAVLPVVVTGRLHFGAANGAGPSHRHLAVRVHPPPAVRHDGRVFQQRLRARANRQQGDRVPALRRVPGQRRLGRGGRGRHGRVFARVPCARIGPRG